MVNRKKLSVGRAEKLPVHSVVLRYVQYDPEQRLLKIELRHGGVKTYSDVPHEIFAELVKGGSPGLFYRTFIEDHYPLAKPAWLPLATSLKATGCICFVLGVLAAVGFTIHLVFA